MDSAAAFEEFRRGISHLPVTEQTEELLGFFMAFLAKLDRETIKSWRDQLSRLPAKANEQETLIELLDGHLALRDIRGDS